MKPSFLGRLARAWFGQFETSEYDRAVLEESERLRELDRDVLVAELRYTIGELKESVKLWQFLTAFWLAVFLIVCWGGV